MTSTATPKAAHQTATSAIDARNEFVMTPPAAQTPAMNATATAGRRNQRVAGGAAYPIVPLDVRRAQRSLQRGRHVLHEPPEVPEPDGAVHPLGDRRGLQARGLATAGARVVELQQRDRAPEPAPAGVLDRPHVVDAAVRLVVEGHRRR